MTALWIKARINSEEGEKLRWGQATVNKAKAAYIVCYDVKLSVDLINGEIYVETRTNEAVFSLRIVICF